MSAPITLNQVCTALRSSFHSIDLRVAAVRTSSTWISLLTAIRISARSIDEIQQRYAELEQESTERLANPFRIFFEARPFSEFDMLIRALIGSQFVVEGENVSLPGNVDFERLHAGVQRYQGLVRSWARETRPALYYPFGIRSMSFYSNETVTPVRQLGWESPEVMTSHFLELDVQQLRSSNIPLCFYVEMPASIQLNRVEEKVIEFGVRAEKNLQGIKLRIATESSNMVPRTLTLEPTGEDRGFAIFRAVPNLKDLKLDDDFVCTLSNEQVPVLDEVRGKFRNFMASAEVNPLLVCLKQFWDMEKFYQRVEHPHQTKPKKQERNAQRGFQQAVSNLLTLVGFQAIDLGEEEILREPTTKVERGTLDILAYYAPSKLLVLGACTIAPPKQEDVNRLLETQAILYGKFPAGTSIRFLPVIFSAQEKETESYREVRILNSRKLTVLRKLVEEGNEDTFLKTLEWPTPFGDGLD